MNKNKLFFLIVIIILIILFLFRKRKEKHKIKNTIPINPIDGNSKKEIHIRNPYYKKNNKLSNLKKEKQKEEEYV